MDTSETNIHGSLNLKTPVNDTDIDISIPTTTTSTPTTSNISAATGLDNKLNSTTTSSLIPSTNDGISYSTTLEDLKFIEQQQQILVKTTSNPSSNIFKNKLSNEIDEMLKQKINTNTHTHGNIKDIDGNGSDCGSDLGSVVDIDIKEFEATL
jgi:hypothetical protein